MVRIRHGWLVAALALGVSVGACKKDEKKPAGDTAAAGSTAGTASGGGAAAKAGASDLDLLPVDSEVVLGINFAQVQQSALWKKFVEPQLMKDDTQKKLAEFKDKCGFDPLTAVTSVSVGLKGVGADTPDGIIVAHGADKGKMIGCLEKMKPEAEKDGDTVTIDGDVVTVKTKDGTSVAMTFANDSTLVLGIGANGTPDAVKAAAAGNSALKSSPTFVDMHSKINTKDSLWLLMNGNSKAFDQAAAMGFKPKAVFGSLNVTDGLSMDLRIRVDSPDQAASLTNMAKGQLAAVQGMVDQVDVANEGPDVKLTVAISATKLEQLVAQFGGMMGGLGGM